MQERVEALRFGSIPRGDDIVHVSNRRRCISGAAQEDVKMGLRIVIQSHLSADLVDATHHSIPVVREGMLRMARTVVRPDTEVAMSYLDKYPGPSRYQYAARIDDISIANKVIEHEAAGYDAVVIPCTFDCGLQECRASVSIPVIGAAEAGMMLAQLVGRRFALVCVDTIHNFYYEGLLNGYGWRDRATEHKPIRAYEPYFWDAMVEAFQGKPEKLIHDFETAALECVRDGADTVVCYETPSSAALALAGYTHVAGTGVPVILPSVAMLKLAEIMADLKNSLGLVKSGVSTGPYQTLPRETLLKIRSDFGL